MTLGGDLTAVSFPALTEVGAHFRVSHSEDIQVITCPLLADVGEFWIDDNASLSSWSLPALDTVGGEFYVTNNPQLPTTTAETLRDQVGLSDIAGTITISGNLN